MTLTVSEFLTGKGAVELLCEIDPNGSHYSDLDDRLWISHQTLINRLSEGVEASLLQRELTSTDQGTSHKYVLSPKGATFRRVLEESATVIAYHQFKQSRVRLEEKKQEMRDWAQTELPKFNEDQHERHLELLQNYQTYHIPEEDTEYTYLSGEEHRNGE